MLFNETKTFSETFNKSQLFRENLRKSSRSDMDAKMRENTYQKVFSTYHEMKKIQKAFSGYAETPILANQYFDASVSSYLNSMSGFISIERDMDKPIALLSYIDVLGISDNRKVLPNLGTEDLSGIRATISENVTIVNGTAGYTLAAGVKIIPNSLKIALFSADDDATYTVTDDGNGNLLAGPNILSAGTVNYVTGAIAFTIAAGYDNGTGGLATITGMEDATGTPTTGGDAPAYNNRFKAEMQNILVESYPDILVGEANLVSLAAMQKSMGIDAADFMASKLTELFTSLINKTMVDILVGGTTGNARAIDLRKATTGYTDYQSAIQLFTGELIKVDGDLAVKSVKGVKATAYVAGTNMISQFKACKAIGMWSENVESSHVNDLVGFFDGVPVLRHTTVGVNDGYAVHKTLDGNAAPLMRGIFLPLTNTPSIGNYNNPTQFAQGVYYQEGHKLIFPELSVKFTVTV